MPANPFGFAPTQNPFITTALTPLVASAAAYQELTSPTLGNPDSAITKYQQNRATSGEWVPDDYAKARAIAENDVQKSGMFATQAELKFLVENQGDIPLSAEDKAIIKNYNQKLTQEQVDRALQESRDIENVFDSTLKDSIAKQNPSKKRFTEVPRQPFVITSQKWINGDTKIDGISSKNTSNKVLSDLQTLGVVPKTQPVEPLPKATPEEQRYIFCNVNPSQISWEFPLRVVDQMTLGGRVQHVWKSPKRNNSYFNEPTVKFSFQSGNIMPLRFVKTSNQSHPDANTGDYTVEYDNPNPGLPAGLDNFYKFFELFNQERIVKVNGNRQANTVYIYYNSMAFPQLMLQGMWDPSGISFEENASEPHQINWSCSMTVYDSYPRFVDYQTLVRNFTSAGFGKISGANV